MRKPQIELTKLNQEDRRKVLMLLECAESLYETVSDIMPQIGGIVVQDYAMLNRGLMLAESMFGKRDNPLRRPSHASK